MKTPIYKDRLFAIAHKRKGGKTVSHGTFRAKRHPNSPRLK